MKLSDELTWRGFVHQHTFSDITEIDEKPLTFYWGVDPSGPSMTIGHLAPAVMIRHLMKRGHKAIILIGGATGIIGDPDGKKQERNLLSLEQIEQNKKNIVEQYERIFSGFEFEVVDNYDWFKDIQYLDFLRDIGKKVPMSQLLDREFIKSRIGEGGEGISYAEFSYNLIQGYDFLHLHRTKGATLQVAGADQWGNSITGVQLIKRVEGAEAHVLTSPLIINKATGVKFGKTEAGAVWLDPTMTTPYQFYQFWLNTDDDFAGELIMKYTMLEKDEAEAIIKAHQERPQARQLQRILADEVTRIVHGDERLASVKAILSVLFDDGGAASLSANDVEALSKEIPTVSAGASLVEALVGSGVVESNGAARRFITSGAVRINGQKFEGDGDVAIPSVNDLIKLGKNKFVLVR